jgi:hypothetical protein
MGLQAPELGGQWAEGLSAVADRNRIPGSHSAPANQAIQIRQAKPITFGRPSQANPASQANQIRSARRRHVSQGHVSQGLAPGGGANQTADGPARRSAHHGLLQVVVTMT